MDHPGESAVLGDTVTDADQRGAIGFAEKVLELLDEGRYTATYKYALLLALMDVWLEHTQSSGAPPEMVTTRNCGQDRRVVLASQRAVRQLGAGDRTQTEHNRQAEIISQSCDSARDTHPIQRPTVECRMGPLKPTPDSCGASNGS